MPFVRLTIANPDLPTRTTEGLARAFTHLVDRILDQSPDETVVTVYRVPRSSWFVGGRGVDGASGVHCELSITAGTSTASQKAEFLRTAYATITAHVMTPAETVYVAIHELDGDGYGFNGVSQHARALLDPAGRD